MSRIDGFSNQSMQHPADRGLGERGASLTKGSLNGQEIHVADEMEMLSESAEEISLFISSKAESKNSADRMKQVMRSLERMGHEEVKEYNAVAELFENAEEEAMFAHLILKQHADPGRAARQRFGRATDQFVALQYALNKGEEEGADGEVLSAIREALDDLDMEHGPRIRADLNTLGAASEGQSSKEELQAFQDSYQDIVMGEPTLAGTLKLALERYGKTDFQGGLERLIKAIGQDLAALQCSCDPARLQNLVQDLYHLRVVSTVLDAAKALLDRVVGQHAMAGGDPVVLMKELVGVSAEKWVAGSRFTTMVEKFGARDPEPQIHMLTGIKQLLRDMPERIFVDSDQRQSVFNAVQEALDNAIDREEEA